MRPFWQELILSLSAPLSTALIGTFIVRLFVSRITEALKRDVKIPRSGLVSSGNSPKLERLFTSPRSTISDSWSPQRHHL